LQKARRCETSTQDAVLPWRYIMDNHWRSQKFWLGGTQKGKILWR